VDRYKLTLLIFTWMLSLPALAEFNQVDSLKKFLSRMDKTPHPQIELLLNQLGDSKEDTRRVDLLNSISYWYGLYDLNQSLAYAKKALTLADKISYQQGRVNAYILLGDVYYYMDDWDRVEKDYYGKALSIARKIGYKIGESICLTKIGITFKDKGGQFTEGIPARDSLHQIALKQIEQALMIWDTVEHSRSLAYALLSKGVVLKEMHDNKALVFYEKALQLYAKMDDLEGVAWTNLRMGGFFPDDCDRATFYYNRAIDISLRIRLMEVLRNALDRLSFCYYQEGQYKKSYDYARLHRSVNSRFFSSRKLLAFTMLESEKKDQVILRNKIQKYILLSGLVLIVLIAVIVWILRRLKRVELVRQIEKSLDVDELTIFNLLIDESLTIEMIAGLVCNDPPSHFLGTIRTQVSFKSKDLVLPNQDFIALRGSCK